MIAEQPAFAWWVPYVLRKRERIIQKVKSQYWKHTHKYGVELPKSVKQVLVIYRNTGTSFWKDAIEKEMKNEMMTLCHWASRRSTAIWCSM
jgi:hypothetical protein